MSNILDTYDQNAIKFGHFSKALKSLLSSLILNEGIVVHSLESRVKNRRSLELKVNRKKRYSCLDDITDIVGVRVITHYSDDVDRIAELVKKEFDIDMENSIDKRKILEPDRFGYLSLHYIILLNGSRSSLSEYGKYKGLKAEIQIRSVLQHAWAEIEHDIGYKSNIGVPDPIRRQFSRLAGLLEIADNEFVNIKNDLEKYKVTVKDEIKRSISNIPIDKVTLVEFMNSNKVVGDIFRRIQKEFDLVFDDNHDDGIIENVISNLSYIKILTLDVLEKKLLDNIELLMRRLSIFSNDFKTRCATDGLSKMYMIIYFVQTVIANENSDEAMSDYYFSLHRRMSENEFNNFMNEIREAVISS